ncbi:hypothetical protein HWV62_32832 [Athelia sp. TMB]|nr:hypothetical protein HWV62_32832 [Athelia sp. TMB]
MPPQPARADSSVTDPHTRALLATLRRVAAEAGGASHRDPNRISAITTPTPSQSTTLQRVIPTDDRGEGPPLPTPSPSLSRTAQPSSSSRPTDVTLRPTQPLASSSSQPIRTFVISDDSADDSEWQEHLKAKKEARRKAKRDAKDARRKDKKAGKQREISFTDSEFEELVATVKLDGNDGEFIPVLSDASTHCDAAVIHPRPLTPPNSKHPSATPTTYQVASPTRVGATQDWHLAGHLTQGVPAAHVHRTHGVESPKKTPPSKSKTAKAYVVYQGRTTGVFEHWTPVEAATTGISGPVFEGFPSLLCAQRAWFIAEQMNVVRTLRPNVEYGPCPAFYGPIAVTLLNFPEDYFGQRFYVVSKGLCPGVYPFWGLAASQVLHVRNAIYKDYTSRAQALEMWQRAISEGSVHTL